MNEARRASPARKPDRGSAILAKGPTDDATLGVPGDGTPSGAAPREDRAAKGDRREGTREDLTGRDRLVWNVIYSWGAHLVFIVSGFIMPRMIDRRLGQELLGVWDFSWSLVSYFQLVNAGITSSVNRYVARYRAGGDVAGLNRYVSSATFTLVLSGLVAAGLAIAVTATLPQLFGDRLGDNAAVAQWVVCLLGLSIAVHIAFGAFNGVLTGCHCWKLHNLNNSGWYAATVVGMVVALLLGGGLRAISVITLIGQVFADVRLMMLAYRMCADLRLRLTLVQWHTIKNVFGFGAKVLVPSISNLLLHQTSSILIFAYVGPAALALYSRPRSLTHQMNSLVNKMAMTLIPTTSALQSAGDTKGIRELLLRTARYSFYMVTPMVLVLVVFGDAIMRLWMGADYANWVLPAILGAGFWATMVQTPVVMTLVGMNAHGRSGLGQFVASLCAAGLVFIALRGLDWGITGAALAVTLPVTVMNIVYLPLLLRRRIGLGMLRYYTEVVMKPAVHVLPFAVCLIAARLAFDDRPFLGLLVGTAVGGIVLTVLYWRYVLPARIKTWATGNGRRLLRATGLLSMEEPTA